MRWRSTPAGTVPRKSQPGRCSLARARANWAWWNRFPATASRRPCWCKPPIRTSPCGPETAMVRFWAPADLSSSEDGRAEVWGYREGGIPCYLPQEAVGVCEEPVAPEEDLLCPLDYRCPGLGGFCEYRVHQFLLCHVVRKREAREPTVLYLVYIDACVGGERRPREERYNHATRLEERHLIASHAGLGPSQAVAVEGYRALEVVHAKRHETYPGLHCVLLPF